MKKVLWIIALAAGIVSGVSAFILGCLYLEDLVKYLKSAKEKRSDRRIKRGPWGGADADL